MDMDLEREMEGAQSQSSDGDYGHGRDWDDDDFDEEDDDLSQYMGGRIRQQKLPPTPAATQGKLNCLHATSIFSQHCFRN